eukprot:Nk52_evm14s359 gene=Nk52_evmTU14s359
MSEIAQKKKEEQVQAEVNEAVEKGESIRDKKNRKKKQKKKNRKERERREREAGKGMKRKAEEDTEVDGGIVDGNEEEMNTKKRKKKGEENGEKTKDRHILFIGNLPYNCTEKEILAHFDGGLKNSKRKPVLFGKKPEEIEALKEEKVGVVSVRMLTKKGTDQPKGCAFLELTDKVALNKCLLYHHSNFKGRKINVELTAGGGGKSEARMEKLRRKNGGLEQRRVLLVKNKMEKIKKGAQEHVKKTGKRLDTSLFENPNEIPIMS